MKFLCIECDEAMKLTETQAPDGSGSLRVLFGCPRCGRAVAMLTNPWETEMVSSLGVRIGPAVPAGGAAAGAGGEKAAGPAMNGAAGGGAAQAGEAGAPAAVGGSRCPFSGVVREMEEQRTAAASGPEWTAEALERLQGIPDFVRPMARQGVEHYATSNGHAVVDVDVLDQARQRFGM